jgi:hypothetical protein
MGTLQKRQERMLQMAGISGQLIDQALMKSGGFKDQKALETARKHNKITADTAMAAIIDAVKHKTHEQELGDVGKSFADSTLAGMKQQLGAATENMFIDTGREAMTPGLLTIAQLVKGTLGKLANDPQMREFGEKMFLEFGRFVNWTKENWPQIEAVVIGATHAIASTIVFLAESFDMGTARGQRFYATLDALATPFKPLFWMGEMLGAEIDYLVQAFDRLAEAPAKLAAAFQALGGLPGLSLLPALGAAPAVPALGGDLGFGAGSALGAGLSSLLSNGITVNSKEASGGGRGVDMSGMQIHVIVKDDQSPQSIAQQIHSEIAKLLRQAT